MFDSITYTGINEKGIVYKSNDLQLTFGFGSRNLIEACYLTPEGFIKIQNSEVAPNILHDVRAFHVMNSYTRGLKMNV